jgi:hypothetical protein
MERTVRDLDRLQQMRLQHRGADWLVARTDEANDQCHLACLDRHRSVRADREADIGLRKFGAIVGAVPSQAIAWDRQTFPATTAKKMRRRAKTVRRKKCLFRNGNKTAQSLLACLITTATRRLE